jgi:hypothetical protein
MPVGTAADNAAFLNDFGLYVTYGSFTNVRGHFKSTDAETLSLPDADNTRLGRGVELLIVAGSLGALTPETTIAVGSVASKANYILKDFTAIEDGAFTRCFLQA